MRGAIRLGLVHLNTSHRGGRPEKTHWRDASAGGGGPACRKEIGLAEKVEDRFSQARCDQIVGLPTRLGLPELMNESSSGFRS